MMMGCNTHGDWNTALENGCPSCVRYMREERKELFSILKSVQNFWDAPPSGLGMNRDRVAKLEQIKASIAAALLKTEGTG